MTLEIEDRMVQELVDAAIRYLDADDAPVPYFSTQHKMKARLELNGILRQVQACLMEERVTLDRPPSRYDG